LRPDAYAIATTKLRAEGFAFNTRTCVHERGAERVELRWNGKVYARRRGLAPPAALGEEP
jgi:hypothetical protein